MINDEKLLVEELVDFLIDLAKDFGKSGFFGGSEMAKDEVSIADLSAGRVVGAEAEAGEIFGVEVLDEGFKAIIAAGAAFFAETELTKGEVEVVAEDEDVF